MTSSVRGPGIPTSGRCRPLRPGPHHIGWSSHERDAAARLSDGRPWNEDEMRPPALVEAQYSCDHPDFADFDFHDPSNLVGVQGSRSDNNIHQQITNEWSEFQVQNPNATRAEIEAFRDAIDTKYADAWWD